MRVRKIVGIVALAVAALALVVLVALGRSLFAEKTPLARVELDRWCAAFEDAEAKFPDNAVHAYDFVKQHHGMWWSELVKLDARIKGMFPGGRYPWVLRFSRHDCGLPDWECPAMDRVMLGVAEMRPMRDEGSTAHARVEVFKDGRITLDDRTVAGTELEATLRVLKERDRVAELYREYWRTRPHPAAKQALDLMVQLRFIVDLRPFSHAQENVPLPEGARLRPTRR
jgi:hypothetical protein